MGKPAHAGLRRKLSVIVVVVIGVVMLPFVLAVATLLQREAQEDSERQLMAITQLVLDLVESQHDTLARTVGQLADGLQLHWGQSFTLGKRRDGGPELLQAGKPVSRLQGELRRLGGSGDATLAALLVRDGERFVTRVANAPRVAIAELAGDDFPLDEMATRGRWNGILRVEGRPWQVALRPLFDTRRRLVGVLLVGVDMARDLQGLRDKLGRFVIGNSGYVFVVDRHPGARYGSFLLHPFREGENPLTQVGDASRPLMEAMLARSEGVLTYDWRDPTLSDGPTRRKLAAFATYPALDWVVGANSYEDEFTRSSVLSRSYMIAAAAAISALLVVVLNLAIGRLVIAPMLRLQRTLRTLSQGNEALVHSTDEDELVTRICGALVDTGGFRFARIALIDAGGGRGVAAEAGTAAAFQAVLDAADAHGEDPGEEALRSRRVAHWPHLPSDRPVLRQAGTAAGCTALIAFPLQDGPRALGALSIGAANAAELDPAGVALLQELSDDLAFGIASRRTAEAHRVAETALRLHERALEASGDGILIIELAAGSHTLRYVNPAVERITGLPRQNLVGGQIAALRNFDPTALDAFAAALDSRRETVVEMTGRQRDGSPLWCECSLAPVAGSGRVSHVVGVIKDVTERTLYLRQLEHQAKYDVLTGLPNRSLLDDRLEQALSFARRHQRRLAVAFLDLDHFKLVNDNLGHRAGDRLLQEVAARLGRALGEGETAARPGGDEFVILLPDLLDEQDAYPVLRRVQETLERPVVIDGRNFFVTASLGVSLFPKDGNDAETLLRNADMAMYQAKEAGRDTIRFFTAEMNARVQERLELEQDLRMVLERDELSIHYQPVVEAGSGRLVGAEALLRWQHPRLGRISPQRFVPLAEVLGLINPIGEWVLATACRQAVRWQEEYGRPLRIAVNVSARQFRDVEFPERVAAVLQQAGLAPGLLELELTESVLMGDADHAAETLARLKQAGILVAIDDFGTGYSSFAYLRHLPLDTLKIDQSFVVDMSTDADAEAIVAAIIAMAHGLRLGVIAEGVESFEQQQILARHGCDELQGVRFGHPVPADEFALYLGAGDARAAG